MKYSLVLTAKFKVTKYDSEEGQRVYWWKCDYNKQNEDSSLSGFPINL